MYLSLIKTRIYRDIGLMSKVYFDISIIMLDIDKGVCYSPQIPS